LYIERFIALFVVSKLICMVFLAADISCNHALVGFVVEMKNPSIFSVTCSLRWIKGKYAPFDGLGHSVLQAVWGVLAIDFNRISVASQVFL